MEKQTTLASVIIQKLIKYTTLIFILGILISCKTAKEEPVTKKKSESLERAELRSLYHEGLKYKLKGNQEGALEVFSTLAIKDKDNDAVFFQLSQLYDARGSFVKALENGEKSRELDPENKWYLKWMATLYKKNSYYNEAADAFGKLVEDDPKNIDYLIAWSETLYLSGQPEKTVEAYDKLEEVYGSEPEVIIRRYQLLIEVESYERALNDAQALVEYDPANGQYYQLLADTYELMGQPEKAEEVYEKMASLEGASSKISMVMAQKYFEQGEDDKGIEALKVVYADHEVGIDTKVQLLLSIYELESAQKESFQGKIKSLLDSLEKTHPESAKTYSIYGDYYLQKENYKLAREKFKKALEFDNSRFPIWNQILLLSYELNDFEKMYEFGEKALNYFPSQPTIYLYKGIGALHTKRCEEAIETLNYGKDLVFENNRLKSEFFQNMGDAYYNMKEYNSAFEEYDKSLDLFPDNAFLLNNYSYYLSLLGIHLDKAEKMIEKANSLIPNQPSFMDTYGWVLFRKEEYQKALEWIEKALKKDAGSPNINEHYGDVLYQLGKKEKALEYWNKAQELDSKSETLPKKIKDKKYYEE